MTKKALLRRIEALEACLGRFIDREEVTSKRLADVEEIVFEVDLMEMTPINQPNRDSN